MGRVRDAASDPHIASASHTCPNSLGSFVPRHPEPPDYSLIQRPLNQSWPLHDGRGWHARGVPDREPVSVWVRIDWERDGQEWLEGTATRWTNAVFVRVDDRRLRGFGVWVPSADVRRAPENPRDDRAG